MKTALKIGAVSLVAAGAFAWVWAQGAETAANAIPEVPEVEGNTGVLNLDCKLGTFRSIDGVGQLDVSFTGALLISKLEGEYVEFGNLRKEFEDDERVCFTGEGRVVVSGSWRAVQWLGADMTGKWDGRGILRVGGEFWENPETGELETGKYWYDEPDEWQPFPSSGVTNVTVPEAVFGVDADAAPRVRTGSGN